MGAGTPKLSRREADQVIGKRLYRSVAFRRFVGSLGEEIVGNAHFHVVRLGGE